MAKKDVTQNRFEKKLYSSQKPFYVEIDFTKWLLHIYTNLF